MKFSQLIEYNKKNIFLGKSYAKCGEETSPRFFSGKLNETYIWINSVKFYTVCFYWILSCGY